MKRIAGLVASCAVVASCSGVKTAEESLGKRSSALTFLTREIDGKVSFTNPPGAVATLLSGPSGIGICGGDVVAQTVGPVPNPPLRPDASGTAAADHLSASYSITASVPGEGCPNSFTYDLSASVNLCLPFGGYFIPSTPDETICQNPDVGDAGPAELGPVTHDITDCAGIVRVTFSSPVEGATMEAFHPVLSPTVLNGGPQARSDYGPGTQILLPVRGDGAARTINAFYTTGTDDFEDKIRRLCQFKDVAVACDQIVDLSCQVDASGTGSSALGTIIGRVDIVTEFLNPLAGDRRTLMWAFTGPFGNTRFFQVPPNPSPATETTPAAFAGESSGDYVLKNLLPSDASIPINPPGTPTLWPVWSDMSLRTGRRTEYFSSPKLGDAAGQPNEAINVTPAPPPIDLQDTFVMKPGFVSGNILLAGPKNAATSCLKDIFRDSDGLPSTAVPPDFSFGAGSFVHAIGTNTLAPMADRTALGGEARVLFDGDFNPATARFEGPAKSYELVLGLLQPKTATAAQAAIWLEDSFVLRFTDPQAKSGMLTDPLSYQNSRIVIADNPAPQFTITPFVSNLHDLHYCFSKVTINYQNVGSSGPGTFFDPRFSASGTFSGTDFEGNTVSYNVGTADMAHGTPLNQPTALTTGTVVACLPQGVYTIDPSVTSVNSDNVSTSNTPLPRASGFVLGCGEDKVFTPPLDVTANVGTGCFDAATNTITASVTSTDNDHQNFPIDTVDVVVSHVTTAADGGTTTVSASESMCTGVDAGAPGSCGGGNPGVCGCAPSSAFSASVTLAQCTNTVTVSATSKDPVTGEVKTSSDTRLVHVDNTPPTVTCPTLAPIALPAGQTSVVVSYPAFGIADDCSQDVVVDCDIPSGSSFAKGNTTVTCKGKDGCHTSAPCTFVVSVGAVQNCPTLACPADATVELSANACQAGPTFNATASDTCAGTAPVNVPHTFAFDAPGSQTFTYTFPGAAPCTQTVTAVDRTPPVPTCSNPTRECTGAQTPVTTTCAATDACPGTVAAKSTAPATFPVGVTPFTCSATDASGNSASSTCQVRVTDTTRPTITAPANRTISVCVGANIGTATASDRCGPTTVTNNAPAKFPLGQTVVTWTARDAAGNTATATEVVTAVLGDDASCCPNGTNVIVGTAGSDRLTGTPGRDCILGRGGDDIIDGGGGDDFISGGAGRDQIIGGFGNDTIFGGADDDTIDSGPGDDFIDGGPGTDVCAGSLGTNVIVNCEVQSGG
jgi:hypothetical protein